jgi:hypothetical protein
MDPLGMEIVCFLLTFETTMIFPSNPLNNPRIFMQNAGERMRFSISSNLQNMWEHKHVLYGTTMREWITIIILLWLL